jgi:hypothetical protein
VQFLLIHLLALLIPLGAGLAPVIALRAGGCLITETEESPESHREGGQTLAPSRRLDSGEVVAPRPRLGRSATGGRSHCRVFSLERSGCSGHRWHNGLSAPLRI